VAAHHGGAWKIAYADFVTAMMAFFLLMWLLGSTTQGDLQGIADYFRTPLKVALAGGSGSGDSSSVVRGGGHDLSRTHGQIARTPLAEVARVLREVDNRLSVSGHTDAQAYIGGERGYSNWELSADRANAARRELLAAGVGEQRIARVVGLAGSQNLNKSDPLD